MDRRGGGGERSARMSVWGLLEGTGGKFQEVPREPPVAPQTPLGRQNGLRWQILRVDGTHTG